MSYSIVCTGASSSYIASSILSSSCWSTSWIGYGIVWAIYTGSFIYSVTRHVVYTYTYIVHNCNMGSPVLPWAGTLQSSFETTSSSLTSRSSSSESSSSIVESEVDIVDDDEDSESAPGAKSSIATAPVLFDRRLGRSGTTVQLILWCKAFSTIISSVLCTISLAC